MAVGPIPPLTVVEGRSESVHVASRFSDPDGDRLAYGSAQANVATSSPIQGAEESGLEDLRISALDLRQLPLHAHEFHQRKACAGFDSEADHHRGVSLAHAWRAEEEH
ncbi:MAG: hypothetical protein F4Z65_07690 [Acidobacteria bacterium]|nr:hypothetical protein [Acidobacteriota bacterium]MYA44997.1 hypothetical protein [Acidobacteriota bacterium]MYI38574.1 hypothetical protein [Acidobacteriota bacterium]